MSSRVLVTRPEPGATKTAQRLHEAGFEPVILPLTEIRPLPVDISNVSGNFDVVAVTSANAIRAAPLQLIDAIRDLSCYAVGEETAAAVRSTGIEKVIAGHGNADALAGRLAATLQPGARILYVCGRVRMPGLEVRLAAAGLDVAVLETYDAVKATCPASLVSSRLAEKPVDAALIYSVRGAEALNRLFREESVRGLLENTRFLCLSGRIAAALRCVSESHVEATAAADEDALFALLGKPASK